MRVLCKFWGSPGAAVRDISGSGVVPVVVANGMAMELMSSTCGEVVTL